MRKLTEQDINSAIGTNNAGFTIIQAKIKRGNFSDSDHYGIALGRNENGYYVTWQFKLNNDNTEFDFYWGITIWKIKMQPLKILTIVNNKEENIMTGWTIRTTQEQDCNRNKFWVMTAYLQSININGILVDPVYMIRKGHNDIKWIGIDALGSWGTLEQAECYIEELGGTKKLGNGYITDANYEYIFSVEEV